MYATQNGWTREKMKAQIMEKMQDHPSVVEKGEIIHCMYRAPDGNQCAAGCFIPDKKYRPMFEDKTILKIWDHVGHLMPLDCLGMVKLQVIHDSYRRRNELDPRPEICQWIDENVQDPEVANERDNCPS